MQPQQEEQQGVDGVVVAVVDVVHHADAVARGLATKQQQRGKHDREKKRHCFCIRF